MTHRKEEKIAPTLLVSPQSSTLEQPQDRLALKAEKLVDTMIGVGEVLREVVEIELKIVKKLVPIVDDLGMLVRASLKNALADQAGEPDVPRIKSDKVNRPVTRGGTGASTSDETS